MRPIKTIKRDSAGVAAVEFALVAPILIAMILGIWNAGLMLFADNGVRDAVEVGARRATIFPRPTQQALTQVINNRYFGPRSGTITGPTFNYGTRNSAPVVTIAMSYTHQIDVPFMESRAVTFDHQRTVYLAPLGNASRP